MKKLLALVLALVMTLSLCVVSSNAAFAGEEYDYDEAVEVMAAVGVFQGDENGKFNGKTELTREQAAKLIAYLDLGEKVAEALPAVKVFNDVEATRWSAKYVAYCADAGYLAGVGNGNFDPTGKLTGYAFGKMLLCALGYDAEIEQFTGVNWQIKVATLMQENDIAKKVSGNASAALTREEAAQYCFNTLKADCVKYDNSTVIKVGDVEIKQSTKAEPYTTGNVGYGNANVQLLEKLYKGDLEYKGNDADDLKRPAHSWEYKDEDVGTYANAADYTFVASKLCTVSNAATLSTALNDQLKLTKTADMLVVSASDPVYSNGNDTGFTNIALGSVVEVYLDDDSKIDVTRVVVTAYTCNQITDVSTKLTKAQIEDGATCKVKINGTYYLDNKIADFDADKFVEDAYVMYVVKGTELIATAFPTEVTGKVTAIKGTKAEINGTYYEMNNNAIAANDEGTFYLGMANEVVAMDTSAAKSTDYAYIYNWTFDTKANADGTNKPTITVYYVTVDGVKASAIAKTETSGATYYIDDDTAASQGMILGTYDGTTFTKDTSATSRVVAFNLNSDGKFVQKAPKNSIVGAPASATVGKTAPVVDHSKVATDDTTFVFVYTNSDGEYKTKLATGYKNVDVTGDMTTVFNSDNEALYTFVAANNSFKTDTKLAVVLDATPTVKVSDGDTFNTYAVAINDEETTLTFKNATLASPYAGMVFAYNMVGDNAEVDTTVGSSGYLTKADVTAKGAGYFGVGGAAYLNTTNASIYTITLEFANEAAKTSYVTNPAAFTGSVTASVGEGATFDVDDPVYYTLKAGSSTNVDVVFVVEYVF